ncbi:MAG TPA: SHOCT domain-containing protein [Steroidobacteraceae bacterium]|nr:SHOCT domain-containing protein [Steroidobacteraceae bacterium]
MHYYWHDGWQHMGWQHIAWWWVSALVIIAVLWVAMSAANRNGRPDSRERILKRRYAGGEIAREEYERKLQELRR